MRPHPHIGLATVTYLFEGAIMHRDSLGSEQKIVPGDVNWMTAGRGIVHSERTPDEDRATGQTMHGIQTWVALPLDDEDIEPSFEHHAGRDAAADRAQRRHAARDRRQRVRRRPRRRPPSPARCTSPPISRRAAPFALDTEHEERGVYLVEGDLEIDGDAARGGQMAVLALDETVTLASANGAIAMLLGGEKLDGERFIEWNFVSSSREKIERPSSRGRSSEMGQVPGETEWIPLPPPRREVKAPEA